MSIVLIKTFIFFLLLLAGLSHGRSHRHRTSTVVYGQNTKSNVYSSASVTVQVGIQVLPYSTPFCDVGSVSDCKIECNYDPTCQIIGFNQERQPPCTCAAQICSDGQIYSSPSFTQSVALTQDEIYSQPHIVAPCQCIIPAEIAPWKQEIDIGQLNGRQNRWPYMNCQTVPYTPSGQGQGQGNGNNGYYTKAELLDDPKANHGISR